VHSCHYYLGNPPPISLYLFYQKQGILAYYYNREGEVKLEGKNISGCFTLSPGLGLWSSELSYDFAEMANVFSSIGLKDKHVLSLTDTTGMSIDTFYHTYSNPDNLPCIQTPLDIWPAP
jgi:hypothetical protein